MAINTIPESGSVGVVERQYFTFAEPPNTLLLDSGEQLGPVTLAYETYGTLNADCSNAVLITHALSGDAHVAGRHHEDDPKPGWWDAMVGPGRAFDTKKYFVICSNVLGGCMGSTGPSSIDPATGAPYGLRFPVITIGDMVRAQVALVEHFGIERLLCVAGGSMGGMQALEWAVHYPTRLQSAMVIASTHHSGAQQIAFDAVGRHAIRSDPNFEDGDYYAHEGPSHGLAIARMLAHITYLSDEAMRDKFGRKLRTKSELSYEFESEFAVETYLDYQGRQFVNRFDANTYLYVTKAMDYFDISRGFDSLDAALRAVQCRMLVVSFSSDWLYPPYQSEQITYALTRQRREVTYCNVRSPYGHDSFLLEFGELGRLVNGFLEHTRTPDLRTRPFFVDASAAKDESELDAEKSIYGGERVDYETIVDLVPPRSRVLDIGCGDGELICQLRLRKQVSAQGIELSQRNVVACVQRGVAVVQGDVDKGLRELPTNSFDFVILSMTLQVLKKPELVIDEMLRVGRRCIISFPNFAFWRIRLASLFGGRAPVTRNLPYKWHETPNRYVLSLKDFRDFCEARQILIEREIPMSRSGVTRLWPNLMADEALYIISRDAVYPDSESANSRTSS